MKKVIVFVAIASLLIGGYLFNELRYEAPIAEIKLISSYDSLEGTTEIEVNDSIIDYENSTIELYQNEQLVDSISLDKESNDFRFDNLSYDTMHEVKLNIAYKFKYYFNTYKVEVENEKKTKFNHQWKSYLKHEGNASSKELIELDDNQMLAVAEFYGDNSSVLVGKYSNDGEMMWKTSLSYGKKTYFGSAIQDGDSILVTGEAYTSSGYKYFMITLDSNGEIVKYTDTSKWFNVNREANGSFSASFGGKLLKTDDSNFMFVSGWSDGFYFIKLNSNFDVISQKRLHKYTHFVDSISEYQVSFIKYKENEYLISTQEVLDSRENNVRLINVNSDGEVLWTNSYKGTGSASVNAIDIDGDNIVAVGSIYFTGENVRSSNGEHGFNAFIMKIDKNGKLIWENEVDDSDWDMFTDVAVDDSGNYNIVGIMREDYHYEGWLWKVDSEGNQVDTAKLNEGFWLNIKFINGDMVIADNEELLYSLRKY